MKKLWIALSMVMLLALATTGFAFAAPEPTKGNLVEVALAVNAETGEFDTLITAVTCPYFKTGFVDLLSRAQLTVFAPTDAAFERAGLTPENICKNFEQDPKALKNILFYHITRGKLDSGAVVGSDMLMMLNRQYADVNVMNDIAYIDGAQIVAVDVAATNGFIHVIDGVMLP